jgi:outer membrane lipoprotein LolB
MRICLSLSVVFLWTEQVFGYLRVAVLLVGVAGCSVTPELPMGGYAAMSKQHLRELTHWHLEGRLSIASPDDSWSANVDWQRSADEDRIQLSGPLGQGAVIIRLGADAVSVDRGAGQVQYSDDPDSFVKEQLGVFVPVRALAYWIVGLSDPSRLVHYTLQGFDQQEWQVDYKEWQSVAGKLMPRKITVVNDKLKLKLVCDQWVIK